ncbi:RTA1-domain-containing protein [Gonapodya prolifera JEL478]|uniref:RTA1-domain-containing protein n=1 Tax=Gonapodya prolifera (strain JEL478) TaxID=1344416 RepID=A0A139AQU2_GONPJ|nr:RTA1-domain-containing protein [Gonapodya prolifera JEL478]|eukprot:KXS19024.1 RTA1-domain-containing protein [Gonapodya prolifera JEL478]
MDSQSEQVDFDWTTTAFDYKPSTALAITFLALFAVSGTLHAAQAYVTKLRFMWIMAIGCAVEILGFGLRIAAKDDVRENPDDTVLFSFQFGLIVLAPIFFAAVVYTTLTHIIALVGDQYSPMKRTTIGVIFITADIFAFIVQFIGACLILIPDIGSELSNNGLKVMIVGLAIQVVGIMVFFTLAVIVYIRAWRVKGRWHVLMWNLLTSAILIAIRNAFRMAEYWDGFDNEISRNESLLYILDAGLMLLLVVLFHIIHPGITPRKEGSDEAVDPETTITLEATREQTDVKMDP